MRFPIACVLGAALVAAGAGSAAERPALGLAGLARAGDWERILEVARLRAGQLPLTPAEALVAAEAARRVGDAGARAAYLERALEDPDIGAVARVELAAAAGPGAAIDLVLSLLRRAPTPELRAAAVAIAARSVVRDGSRRRRRALERALRRLPRPLRRRLEEAIAHAAGSRRRLVRLLRRSVKDLPALAAARDLQALGLHSAEERWLVAQVLYWHAEYDRAARLLERLARRRDRRVPRWRVLFLRGRCAFRAGRWLRAVSWYERAWRAAPRRRDRAAVLVHVARAEELAGNLAGAATAVRKALRLDPGDDRRLFLGRLECLRGRTGAAARVFRRLRGRTARDRSRVLQALAALRRGRPARALELLQGVRGRSGRAPAATVAAGIAAGLGDAERALELLDRAAAAGLDPFWGDAARRLVARLPPARLRAWRAWQKRRFEAAGPRLALRYLGAWAALETDPGTLDFLHGEVASRLEEAAGSPRQWRHRTAAALWRLGLAGLAARWDPGGFPAGDPWSAVELLRHGAPSRAVRAAHAAAARLGRRMPDTVLPRSLRLALYPLPQPAALRRAAAAANVPWELLAALVREESRWRPKATSRVGARGLTQLMPATARRIAAALGLEQPGPDDLFDAEVSLRLGGAELARLLRVFDGRPAPAVAAYNAGEEQARLWLASCPSPCTAETYVLGITFAATRAYTADVLAAARRYAELYPGGS